VKREVAHSTADGSTVAEYKRVLQKVLDARPSGTRRRLAEALGKNRSFISQITNPNYSVPIPARHLDRVFEVCHFSSAEKEKFLEAYRRAHPHRAPGAAPNMRWREVVVRVPEMHDRGRNKVMEDFLHETAQRLARLLNGK
jgi:hypothetical protein